MNRPRVFATRRLPGRALERLAACVDLDTWAGTRAPRPEELAEATRRAEGLLCLLTDRIDAALLDRCPRLRALSSCSVGLDHVDMAAASARDIPVGYTPGVLTETTAELALGLMLAAGRRIVEADRFLRAGGWTRERHWDPELLLGVDLHGSTLGVVGLGAIGTALAARAGALGMRVLGWSRTPRDLSGVEQQTLEALLARSDFVSIHLALTARTRGLIDAAALARMRPHAILVNTARGGIVDELALCEALAAGRLGGAALDVFASEPLDPKSPLLSAPNLILTPHIGSASAATRRRMAELAVDNLLAALEDRPMPRCANPEAERRRLARTQPR